MEEQQFNLREGAEIIIATPGRLKDVIERHVLVLSQCRYIVMDEADRMVHLGFEVDLTFILDALPTETMQGEDTGEQMDVDTETMVKKGRTRVTTLFSATMPPAVERLARKYLKKPAVITIGEAGRAVDTVEQRVEFVSGDEKKKYVCVHHTRLNGTLTAISGQTTATGDPQQRPVPVTDHRVCQPEKDGGHGRQGPIACWGASISVRARRRFTCSGQWSAATLHSGKNQEQREASLQSLRNGEADVLVATDLAGRGIDVQDVSLVINFQMSSTIEAYVHRIGKHMGAVPCCGCGVLTVVGQVGRDGRGSKGRLSRSSRTRTTRSCTIPFSEPVGVMLLTSPPDGQVRPQARWVCSHFAASDGG